MLPAKPFYLLRHGQSEANAANITAGGNLDSPLTELGVSQPKTLAPYMEQLELQPQTLYHSTMVRAHDTATYVNAEIKLPMTASYELREHDLGSWEGQPWENVLPRIENDEYPEDGETLSMFAQRIQSILTDILEKEEETPLVVAHGGLFFAIGSLYEYGMSHIQNCHLHLFEPCDNYTTFPWRVWMFDIDEAKGKLVKRPAPFCLSQALQEIA